MMKAKTMRKRTLSIRLDRELSAWLEQTCERIGVSPQEFVRAQLEGAMHSRQPQPFIRLAGSVSGLPKNLSRRKGFSRRRAARITQ